MSSRTGQRLITWKCECPPEPAAGISVPPGTRQARLRPHPLGPQLSRGRAGSARDLSSACWSALRSPGVVLGDGDLVLVRLRRWGPGAAVNLLRRVACDQFKRRGGDENQERDALRRWTEHGIDSARACALPRGPGGCWRRSADRAHRGHGRPGGGCDAAPGRAGGPGWPGRRGHGRLAWCQPPGPGRPSLPASGVRAGQGTVQGVRYTVRRVRRRLGHHQRPRPDRGQLL